MNRSIWFAAVALLVAASLAGCASTGAAARRTPPAAPMFPSYPVPEIPAQLTVSDALRARHDDAWYRLQSGDPRGAAGEWRSLLENAPGLYPAEVGIGFAALAEGDYAAASSRFAAAASADPGYMPALLGQVEALLGLERDLEAIEAMERVLAVDPAQTSVRTRLDLVRFRLIQSAIEAGRAASASGRHADAVTHLERALSQSPDSPVILGELARAELGAGRIEAASTHARRAAEIDATDGQWHALVGAVLEAQRQFTAAADAYARAISLGGGDLDSWRTRERELRDRAEIASLPAHFQTIASAPTITRADVAAYVGIHLRELVDRAPSRAATVATDVRSHWAEPWILTMARTGVMPVFPNHTFQPAGVVRRGDLAAVGAALARLAAADRPAQLQQWSAARPQFADLPPGNLFYEASALATAAGIMAPDAAGRFEPTRPATGAELQALVDRVAALRTAR
jgi:tetratricopeptide (TPR) repeat protein